MLKHKKILSAFCAGIVAVFMIGVVNLFLLRFEAGDVYPAYSSLRADPMGTRAFYESLENLNHVTVRRNYRPLSKLVSGKGTTLFFLGADTRDLEVVHKDTLEAISRFTASGGRLVVSFLPVTKNLCPEDGVALPSPCPEKETKRAETDESHQAMNGSEKDKASESTSTDSQDKHLQEKDKEHSWINGKSVSLLDHWGIALGYDREFKALKQGEGLLKPQAHMLPKTVSCHTVLYFDSRHDAWDEIYTHNDHPVIMERGFGKGSVVFCAESYFFSNEALFKERHPGLLAWLVGGGSVLVFDESHFGIREDLGIAGLARKYHLHGFFMVLILVAGLFVWKNAVYFVPPVDQGASAAGNNLASEKDHTEGLISLLRRNISHGDILRVCFEEWTRSFSHNKALLKNRSARIRAVIDSENPATSKQGNPVRGYKTICKILSERNP